MSNEAPQPAPEKPTLWQRATGSVKNFFSHALGYIPRGIVLTGLIFGVSAALGRFDMDLLGINHAAETGALLPRFLGHLALGSVISGVIGATTAPCTPCQQTVGGVQPRANPLISKSEVELGQKISQSVADQATHAAKGVVLESVAPGTGTTNTAMQFVGAAANAMGGGRTKG